MPIKERATKSAVVKARSTVKGMARSKATKVEPVAAIAIMLGHARPRFAGAGHL